MFEKQKIKLAITLLALSLGLIFVSFLDNRPSPLSLEVLEKPQAKNPAIKIAPSGKIIGGFPTNFILDKNPKIAQSYRLDYPDYIQFTINYLANNSASAEFQEYINSLQKSFDIKYSRQSVVTAAGNFAAIYGQGSKADVSLQISSDPQNQTIVVFNYLLHK